MAEAEPNSESSFKIFIIEQIESTQKLEIINIITVKHSKIHRLSKNLVI